MEIQTVIKPRPAYQPDDLLTIEQLAEYLGRAPSTVRGQVSTAPDKLPPRFQPPGTTHVRFRWKDVVEFVDSNIVHGKRKRKKA